MTELVTGLDLVREQILIAAGKPLSLRQEDVRLSGHAIECRINAEDVSQAFRPAPGRVTAYREPAGPGVRVDSGVTVGTEISPLYDPLVAKVIVHAPDREQARRRMLRALEEFVIEGPLTLLGFHRALLAHPCFVEGATCHGIVESQMLAQQAEELSHEKTSVAPSPDGAVRARQREVEVDGRLFAVTVVEPEPPWGELVRRRRERTEAGDGAGGKGALTSPMQGTVLAVHVAEGDEVAAGQLICIVEAMKMENEIHAQRSGNADPPLRRARPAGDGRSGDLRRRVAIRRLDSPAAVDLYEYQGKQLFRRFGIPVSEGRLATSPEEARAAAVDLGGAGRRQGAGPHRGQGQGRRSEARRRSGGRGAEGPRDPGTRHSRAPGAQALDRARVRHREGVLPLRSRSTGPRRNRFSCSRRKVASRSSRSPRRVPTHSRGCTSTSSRTFSRTKGGASSTARTSRTPASSGRCSTSSESSMRASRSPTRCCARSTR